MRWYHAVFLAWTTTAPSALNADILWALNEQGGVHELDTATGITVELGILSCAPGCAGGFGGFEFDSDGALYPLDPNRVCRGVARRRALRGAAGGMSSSGS